jgi:tRNA modification GTPase
VRISGPQALPLALRLTKRTELVPRQAQFSSFYVEQEECLDQGLVLYFKAPHSFTGEDVVEFHCHGSPIVLDRLLNILVVWGAELAKPGEFSLRAYLNDKMDLTQAEAVADLIQADSITAAKMALRSLQGDFSKRIQELNQQLIYLRLYVEAGLDFPDEEIDLLSDGTVLLKLQTLQHTLAAIRAEAAQGTLMREGLTLVIAGRPNAGKSTLMNCLAQRDVAIVTPIAGTTRDVMQEHILLDDIPLRLLDTAGLRVSEDIIEQEGINRAYKALGQADCVIMMHDCTDNEQHDEAIKEINSTINVQTPRLLVYNKIDKLGWQAKREASAVYLSLKTGDGVPLLKQAIKDTVGYQPLEGQFLARRRHLEALDRATSLLQQGLQMVQAHHSGELLAEDLRLAHLALGEITGEFSSDDLLGKIFSSFCIGK